MVEDEGGWGDCSSATAVSPKLGAYLPQCRRAAISETQKRVGLLSNSSSESQATCAVCRPAQAERSEEHTSELQSPDHLVCRLLLEKKKHRSGGHCPQECDCCQILEPINGLIKVTRTTATRPFVLLGANTPTPLASSDHPPATSQLDSGSRLGGLVVIAKSSLVCIVSSCTSCTPTFPHSLPLAVLKSFAMIYPFPYSFLILFSFFFFK